MIEPFRIEALGNLHIIDIFDYFDKPLFMGLVNELGHSFLAKLADEDDEIETWLFLPISNPRYFEVKAGNIDIQTAFKNPEIGYLYKAILSLAEKELLRFEKITPDLIPPIYLPPEGDKLDNPTETLPKLLDPIIRSKQLNRVVLLVHLIFADILTTEAPVKPLGNFLNSLQNLLESIGQALKDLYTERGRIPLTIVASDEMRVIGIGPGSFEIELASAKLPNLFGESEIDAALTEFINLINSGSNAEELKTRLKELKPRVAKDYYDLLSTIGNNMKGADIRWAAPKDGVSGNGNISSFTAKAAMGIIELAETTNTEDAVYIGELVGANLRSKKFEILVNGEKIDGDIPGESLPRIKGAAIGTVYKMHLRKKTELKLTTGKLEYKYELIEIL